MSNNFSERYFFIERVENKIQTTRYGSWNLGINLLVVFMEVFVRTLYQGILKDIPLDEFTEGISSWISQATSDWSFVLQP